MTPALLLLAGMGWAGLPPVNLTETVYLSCVTRYESSGSIWVEASTVPCSAAGCTRRAVVVGVQTVQEADYPWRCGSVLVGTGPTANKHVVIQGTELCVVCGEYLDRTRPVEYWIARCSAAHKTMSRVNAGGKWK